MHEFKPQTHSISLNLEVREDFMRFTTMTEIHKGTGKKQQIGWRIFSLIWNQETPTKSTNYNKFREIEQETPISTNRKLNTLTHWTVSLSRKNP